MELFKFSVWSWYFRFELRRSLLAMFAERSFLADCDKNGKEHTVDCTDQPDGIVNSI